MQLNNINGKSIKLDKIDILQNRIVYSIYEYGTKEPKVVIAYKFKDIQLKDYLNQTVNYEELCYTNLALENETDYVISEDIQNWTISIGLDGDNTVIRVYLPQALLNEHIFSGSDLDLLIESMKHLTEFKQVLGKGSMQYLVTLDPSARLVLEKYEGIIIENKI